MRTLDWKIAFAGGAVAGLTIGGFAIAQADDVQAPAVDGIGLPGATAQASPVDPMSSPASTTLVAESARQAAADAVAALADSPVDLDTTTILAATPALHPRLVSFLND